MTNEEYDQAVKELAAMPPREWVVCRSKEEAYALAAWIEDFEDELISSDD